METAKVDIRRLQLLNDRITQCLDALNQVRLSVHGLSHSALPAEGQIGASNPLTQDPRFAMGIPWQGAAPIGFAPPQAPLFGLSHSSPEGDLYSRTGLTDPFFAVKVAQTFPYARFGAPPVVALY